ncbi:SDR family oxidoreductase [Homoserinimonas sp. OAct 916]|uniref:SDR family oxidoreductase n=1 Tax=Homoserinimonas sp. OAct 916 TaxID=2211450 RepID=UPI000DBE9EFF|nr:SDR family oxidoreductase [Homoserinimonas sp. OAct 916]
MGKLDGKIALITGGSHGMGAADAKLFAAEGARVIIGDVLDDEGQALADSIGAEYRRLDVTSESNWTEVVADIDENIGHIDILVNNAGIVAFTPVATTELSEWNRVIEINLTGVFLGIRSVAASMKAAGGGVIVNLSSSAGMMGYSNLSAYVASKWGVRGLTKAAALDLGPDNIRVVSVHPGGIRTPMTAGMEGNEMYASQAIPRIGEPEEVAKLVLYLVADATYSTGTEFIVDGGATVGQALNF